MRAGAPLRPILAYPNDLWANRGGGGETLFRKKFVALGVAALTLSTDRKRR